jgi:hypothetical protein
MCACVHVCMCACVHVCMCACVHVCMCACVHVCMCACVHVCMCVCVYVMWYGVCACVCLCLRVHVSAESRVAMCENCASLCGVGSWVRHNKVKKLTEALKTLPNATFDPRDVAIPYLEGFGTQVSRVGVCVVLCCLLLSGCLVLWGVCCIGASVVLSDAHPRCVWCDASRSPGRECVCARRSTLRTSRAWCSTST